MKILIIGYGKVGSVLARLLAEQSEVEKIICTYRTEKPPENFPKISFVQCDAASPRDLAILLLKEPVEVVVNCSLPQYNKNILEACLQQHHHYIDLASSWEIDTDPKALSPYKVEQLEYTKEFKKNNLRGLINAGVSPGLTNLIAAYAATMLKEVDFIKIRLLEECKTKTPFLAWSAEESLEALRWKPLVWQKGSFHLKELFSGEEQYVFPSPYGKKKVWLVAQEEVGTIPLFLKVQYCDIKVHDHLLKLAKQSLGSNLDALKRSGPAAAASHPNHDAAFQKAVLGVMVEAGDKEKGKKKKIKLSVLFPTQREIDSLELGANYITYPTALMTSLFIRSLPLIKQRGVFPPEVLEEEARKFIFRELKKVKGVRMEGFYSGGHE